MKLLLDQNLSPRLVQELKTLYPGSAHVREFELQAALDQRIWQLAKAEGFTIVSKDADFHQLSFLHGPPPKVVWLRAGNCTSERILAVLLGHRERIHAFEADADAALLVLP